MRSVRDVTKYCLLSSSFPTIVSIKKPVRLGPSKLCKINVLFTVNYHVMTLKKGNSNTNDKKCTTLMNRDKNTYRHGTI